MNIKVYKDWGDDDFIVLDNDLHYHEKVVKLTEEEESVKIEKNHFNLNDMKMRPGRFPFEVNIE